MVSKLAILGVLVVVVAYYFISHSYMDWSIPIVSLPVVGTVLDFKPFQFLADYGLFVGAVLAIIFFSILNRRRA